VTKTDDELIVRAAVSAPADLPMEVVARIGDQRTFTLLTAASALAIVRKYRTLPEPARVREFVEELQFRFPDAARLIKPIVFEAMVRFAFGEDDAIDGLEPESMRTAVFLLPYAIISDENIHGEPLDEFITEVVKAANGEG
jgi:hypothetical protein